MELIYLWVEKYKNIENQGFNFSPRFTCKYENGELTIEEKKDYVSIFPENINVTAIVGENGSGKSNLLELLPYGLRIIDRSKPIFFIFKNDNEYILFKYSSTEVTIKTEKNVTIHDDLEKFSDEYQIKRIAYDTDFTKENFSDKNIFSILDSTVSYGFSHKNQYLDTNNKSFNIKKYKHIFNELMFSLKDELLKFDSFFKPSYIKISNQNGSNINLEINETIAKLEKLENKKDNLDNLIEELTKNKNELMSFKYNQKIFMQDLDTLKILFKAPLQDYFYIDFYNEQDINFSEFSQGERSFCIHFIFLTYMYLNHTRSNENINTFFVIDEPEITFHPNWQKKYIKDLINIFKNYNNNIHFIITSHSPFLLSDLPKDNVIFLENGKQVYPNIETFGANIHTLLSHGFFMKDGLMGEFAENKINEVIDYLNGKNSPIEDDDEVQRYIRIIGEPIVKRQLQRMLDSKKLDKMKEIDVLKNQIESLQSRLDNLEKKS